MLCDNDDEDTNIWGRPSKFMKALFMNTFQIAPGFKNSHKLCT